jgi:hypothetical protein
VLAKTQLLHTAANDDGVYNLVQSLTNEFYVWSQAVPGTTVLSETILGPRLAQETGRFRTGLETQNTSSNFWFDAKTGVMELRIPWNLLNITDPSQRMAVDDDGTGGFKHKELHVVPTPGIAVAVVALAGAAEGKLAADPAGELVDSLPQAKAIDGLGPKWRVPAAGMLQYAWPTWDKAPAYHEYRKASYFILRDNLAKVLPSTVRLSPAPSAPGGQP